MQDPHGNMYELEYPVPDVPQRDDESGPALLIAMHGYADAGQAIELGSNHLLAALENSTVAMFNHDELIDYRSRRPATNVTTEGVKHIGPLGLELHVLKDTSGTPFLLLSGPEPDLRWNAFTEAVGELVNRFNVGTTICLYSAAMTVPHTRPLVVSAHGNDPALVEDMTTFDAAFTVPGSASLHIEKWLNDRKKKVAGYTAHVPHYVAASPYPQAAIQLLREVQKHSHLELPLAALEADAETVAQQMQEQLDDSREIQQVVAALEQQYDEEAARHREQQALEHDRKNVPDADELGAQFEQYLADFTGPEDDDSDKRSNPHPDI